MSWYKNAQQYPQDFKDRNALNDKIRYFESVIANLEKLSKVVFQSGVIAKQEAFKIAEDKKMSPYPKIRDLLLEASNIALDSPWRFADMCLDACDEADRRVREIERIRKHLIEDTIPNKARGWIERHGR